MELNDLVMAAREGAEHVRYPGIQPGGQPYTPGTREADAWLIGAWLVREGGGRGGYVIGIRRGRAGTYRVETRKSAMRVKVMDSYDYRCGVQLVD